MIQTVPPLERVPRSSRLTMALRAGAWAGITGGHLVATTGRRLARRPHREPGLIELLTRLGPTFVKGGQLLSTRTDVLSERRREQLRQLHDRVAPMSAHTARTTLALAYPGGSPFARIAEEPAGSGSIASVYQAWLPDDTPVAVKVRRPGIGPRMRTDFELLGAGARLAQRLPGLHRVPMCRMVRHVSAAVLQQLDLAQEAVALATLRRNLADVSSFRIPAPLPELSRDDVLVMEWIPGLRRFRPGELTREQRRQIVRQVLQGVYRMLFVDGLVHCDMHPGNLYLSDADVVLLDAGFVVQLDPQVRRLFAEFFLNMSLGRGEQAAEVVLRSAEHVPASCDLAAFRSGVRELVESTHRRTAGQFRLGPFATRLFDLQRRSGIAAAPEFVFPLMSLLVLEGMINEFDVDVDFQAEAIPTLLAVLR
ncbi:AarF/UbiB family protein [Micromonospora sp. FIMYZ51]|uniref:ABC1 kinase family protein n=1 Tax=Micromonospora sp. FIMYZ51 TaxID=3051832 RepID=UPI00311E6909